MNVVFVTGNAHKAMYFSELVGHNIPHQKADTPELQSLDLTEVVTEKAKAAYKVLCIPVIVEDSSVVIHSMGRLPGTFIKWFLEEVGFEKICRLADISADRSATAGAAFCYYDGHKAEVFLSSMDGTIAREPRGDSGFGWNQLFIPKGDTRTLAEMSEADFREVYVKIKPFPAIKEFLDNLQA